MSVLTFLWKNSKTLVIWAILTSIACGLATAGLVAWIHYSLSHLETLTSQLALGFAGLCAVSLFSGIVAQVLLIRLSQGAIYNLRMQLSRQILATPLRRLEILGPHRLLTALTDDIQSLSYGLLGIPIICVQVMIALGCLVYLGWLSLPMLGVVLGFLMFAMLSYWIPSSIAIKRLERARESQDQMFKHFRAITEGAKELKMNARRRRSFMEDHLHSTAERYCQQNVMGFSIYAAAANWGYLSFFLLIGTVLFLIPGYFSFDQSLLTGTILILLYLRSPLELIFSLIPEFARSQIALKKLNDLGLSLSTQSDAATLRRAAVIPSEQSVVALKKIMYNFHQEDQHSFQLGPLDLSFQQGEVLFIIGGNGSGKSTLVKLIAGLYEPEAGEIYFNHTPVKDPDVYRQNFATIFSDFFLFEKLLGVSADQLDDKAKEYLMRLELDHKVKVDDGKLSTLDLSQGQRKRLALLTAYLEDRPFFIFDEWAADQDPYFKEIFYTQILPELKMRGKGVVVITHDDKYFKHADRIVKLDYGKVDKEIIPQEDYAAEPVYK